jgi:hypothetical protein
MAGHSEKERNVNDNSSTRRLIERDYFDALAQAITLDVWREIVERQISDAKDGDAKARDWIARFVLGEQPMTLTALAEKEALGIEPVDEILAGAESALEEHVPDKLTQMLAGGLMEPSERPIHRVLRLKQERQRRAPTSESSTPSDSSTSESTGPIGSEPPSEK